MSIIFTECWDRHNNLFYSFHTDGDESTGCSLYTLDVLQEVVQFITRLQND